MYAKELRNKTKEELNEQIKSFEKEIKETMDKLIKGKDKNVKKPGNLRRDIARVKTVLAAQAADSAAQAENRKELSTKEQNA